MTNISKLVLLILAALSHAGIASSQLLINEIYLNPPGFAEIDDAAWEYIEFYGRPGMDLTGYAFIIIKDETGEPERLEIDEAYSLDGCSLDENGIFVLVNTDDRGRSEIAERYLESNLDYDMRRPESGGNRRWKNGLSFGAAHIPSGTRARYLSNDGLATTLMIVRCRPGHEIVGGQSRYAIDYGWRKDVRVDLDRDGLIDSLGRTAESEGSRRVRLSPVQVVDAVGWRNDPRGVTIVGPEHEVTDVRGFIPDALSRVAMHVENPQRGHRTIDQGDDFSIARTTIADESFVVGEIKNSGSLQYVDGFDSDGWSQHRSPTDLNASAFDGGCDPEPDHISFPGLCLPRGDGVYRFYDTPLNGFSLTPGRINVVAGRSELRQHPIVEGDVDFDGVVDARDHAYIDFFGLATIDEKDVDEYKWTMARFQMLLAIRGDDLCVPITRRDGLQDANPEVER